MEWYLTKLKNMPTKQEMKDHNCVGIAGGGQVSIVLPNQPAALMSGFIVTRPEELFGDHPEITDFSSPYIYLLFEEDNGWTEELKSQAKGYIEKDLYLNQYEYFTPADDPSETRMGLRLRGFVLGD